MKISVTEWNAVIKILTNGGVWALLGVLITQLFNMRFKKIDNREHQEDRLFEGYMKLKLSEIHDLRETGQDIVAASGAYYNLVIEDKRYNTFDSAYDEQKHNAAMRLINQQSHELSVAIGRMQILLDSDIDGYDYLQTALTNIQINGNKLPADVEKYYSKHGMDDPISETIKHPALKLGQPLQNYVQGLEKVVRTNKVKP